MIPFEREAYHHEKDFSYASSNWRDYRVMTYLKKQDEKNILSYINEKSPLDLLADYRVNKIGHIIYIYALREATFLYRYNLRTHSWLNSKLVNGLSVSAAIGV